MFFCCDSATACSKALREYAGLGQGWNTLPGGEEVYYIQNPALGLWMAEDRA